MRELLGELVVENKTALAVAPRPDVFPFFNAVAGCLTPGEITYGRKRRGSNTRLPHEFGVVVVAEVPPRRVSGRSQRTSYHAPRRRKLSPEQEAAIRALAGTKGLRWLGAAFGVSHETVRGVIRPKSSAMANNA